MVSRPWSFPRLSCRERLLLRCDGKARNSFPTTQGKDPSSQARRRKRGSSGCGRDSRAYSRVETGMSGNFLSCSKGVKDPWKFQMLGVISLETPQRTWASSRLEGQPPGLFLVAAGALVLRRGPRDPLWWPQERPVPCELLGGLSGFLCRPCRGLRPCVELEPELEDSSPVLTWILGYLRSLPTGVNPGLK